MTFSSHKKLADTHAKDKNTSRVLGFINDGTEPLVAGFINDGTEPLVFEFINDGTEPLIISRAKGTDVCAVSQYPKKPVKPGQKGKIVLKCDLKMGKDFKEKIILSTNAINGKKGEKPGRFILQVNRE